MLYNILYPNHLRKICRKERKKDAHLLGVMAKVRTFASAFGAKPLALKKRSLKNLHKREQRSSTRKKRKQTVNQTKVYFGILGEGNLKKQSTMESLILAQDER